MTKVSIGLRGWRFDEDAVFTEDGEFRPLEAMPADTRDRLTRLAALVAEPCHACWLVHGDEAVDDCNVAAVVYGEPRAEVLLCSEHEPDFLYWYREAGGDAYRGEDALRDAFYDWFREGNRAPDGYGRDEHVDTDPDALPDPAVEAGASCDVHLPDPEGESADDDPLDDDALDDLAREYPS
jgi:hypothetical protein